MHPVVHSVLKEQQKRFKRIFGRLPQGDDPLQFDGIDPYAAEEAIIEAKWAKQRPNAKHPSRRGQDKGVRPLDARFGFCD
jgi:hypothetical protein